MIPDTPEISTALENLVVGPFDQVPGDDKVLVCNVERFAPVENPLDGPANPNVASENRFPIGLGFQKASPLKLVSLARIVEKTLVNANHAGLNVATAAQREKLAMLFLAMAQISIFRKNQVRNCLLELLRTLDCSRLDQLSVLPFPAANTDVYEFGEFRYGQLDTATTSDLCKHAGSDYFQLHGSKLKGRLAICRSLESVIVLNHARDFFRYRMSNGVQLQRDLLYRLIDEYFQLVSEIYWEDFFTQLDRQQALSAVAGVGYISSRAISPLLIQTARVSVFTREKFEHGWVAPVNTAVDIVIPQPSELKSFRNRLNQSLRFDAFGKSGLDEALQLFSEYMYTVADHELRNRDQEALLHCVFALDLLLGGRAGENLSIIIKERVAALVSSVSAEGDYSEVQTFVQQCYGFRSGYAHRGERGPLTGEFQVNEAARDRLTRMVRISRIVFAAGCFARQQIWCTGLDVWHNLVDVLRAKLNAGLPTTDDTARLGLNCIRKDILRPECYVVDWNEVALQNPTADSSAGTQDSSES